MIRKLVTLSAVALFALPAFAETGVGTMQIDNVAQVYGRAGVPAVKVTGIVVTKSSDVNVAGRESFSGAIDKTVISSGENVDQAFGRS
jgi:ABC-type glucose/galactose transport system permease subunit